MNPRITKIACLAAAAAAVGGTVALPAAAGAKGFGFKQAKYRIEISGVQTTAWKVDSPIKFDCDVGSKGDATEVVRFSTPSFAATVTSYDKANPTFMIGRKFGAERRFNAKVTRRSNFKQWTVKACADGDGTGGQAPPAPDCGQKNLLFYAQLRFSQGRLMIDDGDDDLLVPMPGYRNCVIGGTAFPNFLWRGGKHAVGKPLTGPQLFRGPQQRTITVGRRDVYQDAERWHETTIRYTVTLTRLTKVRSF